MHRLRFPTDVRVCKGAYNREYLPLCLGDRSLITGRGKGDKTGGGRRLKFYPYKKMRGSGGSGNSFNQAEGGVHNKF